MSGSAREAFEASLARLDAGQADGLVQCALVMAQANNPELDVARCGRELDDLSRAVAERLSAESSDSDRLEALNEVLFKTFGLHGNQTDYYNARNNFLDYVLEERTGIPITLSLVYMELGRRIGLSLQPVGLPGHVVVRLHDTLFIDAFHGGMLLDRDGVETLTRAFLGPDQAFLEAWLEPLQPRSFLARMLRNLKHVYASASDMEHLSWVCDWLVLVLPDDLVERRDRGLVFFSMRRFGLAAADLEYCLQRLVDEEERQTLEELYRKARHLQAKMN